jgi:ribosome-associated toxin RatA of RatAB toxin-antitoxin module
MFINKIFIVLLPFLALCFHKQIPHRPNLLCKSTRPDIVLPELTTQDKMILAAGEMIEKQYRNGYTGTGFVVVDIQLSPDVVFDTLTQFAKYQDMIPIVKSSTIISSDGGTTMAEYVFTRFLLSVNVKHTVLEQQRMVKFTLDPNRTNPIFREAKGFWHVEIPTDRQEGYCRIYLSAQVVIHKIVPTLLIDYAATTALSRGTKWLKPFFANLRIS